MQNWFLGVQRSLGKSWVAEVDYVGSVGRHLYATYNVNRFDGDLMSARRRHRACSRACGEHQWFRFQQHQLRTGQRKQQLQRAYGCAQKECRLHGLTFNASYTYSKAIDDSSRLDGPEHVEAFQRPQRAGSRRLRRTKPARLHNSVEYPYPTC